MTPELVQTLCDHAAGNYRVLCTLAAELLDAAARDELVQLDEKLYYNAVFSKAICKVSVAESDLVIVPTALGAQWEIASKKVIPMRAFENGVCARYADHCDQENGLVYCGGSYIVASDGNDLVRAEHTADCLIATLTLDHISTAKRRYRITVIA